MIKLKSLILEGLKDSVYLEPKTKEEVMGLINRHYLKKYPAVVSKNYGVMYKKPDGTTEMVGAIIYGQTTKPQDYEEISVDAEGNSLLEQEEVIELLRLYLVPEVKSNPDLRNLASFVISQGNKKIKEDRPETKVIITRADTGQGHTGTVYQATGAIYLGQSKDRMDLWDKKQNKWLYRKRELEKYGFSSLRDAGIDAKTNPNSPYEWKLKTGKHMYIYILSGENSTDGKRIIASLVKGRQPYPKKQSST
jgi:hypothetical protein